MSNTVTKTLKVRYQQEGASETERMAKAIARAQQTVAEASAGAYKVMESGTTRLGGAERGYRALQSRLEGMGRATKQFHADLKALDGAMSAGIIKGAEYSRQLAKIQTNLQSAGAPTGADTGRAFDISKRFGIGAEISNPARASASVFEEAERAAERLRAELDPLGAAQRRMNAELETYRGLAAGGAISSMELARAQEMIGARMAMAEKTMSAAGGATKLTANQFVNLGYQVNDVSTMLAMGASPLQILASQGGQVVQALGDGPGGVKGSLAAIGTGIASMITPTTAIVAGLAAASAAVVYFASSGTRTIPPLNDALEAHRKVVGEIADQYGVAIAASKRYASEAEAAFSLRRSTEDLRFSARSEIQKNFTGILQPAFDGERLREVIPAFAAFEGPLVEFRDGLRAGEADAVKLIDSIARLANQNPMNTALQDGAAKLIEYARGAAEAQRQIESLTRSQTKLKADTLKESMTRLRDFVPDRRTDADRINGEADRASGLARSYGELMQIERQRQSGLSELARAEVVIRAGHDLDIRSIGIRSAAERAEIDAMRTRLDLSGAIMTEEEKGRRISEVRSLSLAQSRFQESESLRQRIETEQAAVAGMQFELGILGKTAGETARLRTEFDALADAKRTAFEEGRSLGEEEIDRIKRHASEVGHLTDALAMQKLAQEASFDRSQLFRSDEQQQAAASLRDCGIDIGEGVFS